MNSTHEMTLGDRWWAIRWNAWSPCMGAGNPSSFQVSGGPTFADVVEATRSATKLVLLQPYATFSDRIQNQCDIVNTQLRKLWEHSEEENSPRGRKLTDIIRRMNSLAWAVCHYTLPNESARLAAQHILKDLADV